MVVVDVVTVVVVRRTPGNWPWWPGVPAVQVGSRWWEVGWSEVGSVGKVAKGSEVLQCSAVQCGVKRKPSPMLRHPGHQKLPGVVPGGAGSHKTHAQLPMDMKQDRKLSKKSLNSLFERVSFTTFPIPCLSVYTVQVKLGSACFTVCGHCTLRSLGCRFGETNPTGWSPRPRHAPRWTWSPQTSKGRRHFSPYHRNHIFYVMASIYHVQCQP